MTTDAQWWASNDLRIVASSRGDQIVCWIARPTPRALRAACSLTMLQRNRSFLCFLLCVDGREALANSRVGKHMHSYSLTAVVCVMILLRPVHKTRVEIFGCGIGAGKKKRLGTSSKNNRLAKDRDLFCHASSPPSRSTTLLTTMELSLFSRCSESKLRYSY